MSFRPTQYRPFARCGWGGPAASHFRGAISLDTNNLGMQGEDPQVLGVRSWGQIGTVLLRSVGGRANFSIVGVTCLGAGGAALGGCRVDLFVVGSAVAILTTTSDASGNFRFDTVATGPFFLRAYSSGTPDLAGVSVNNLMAT